MKNGQGKLTHSNGQYQNGIWKNDEFESGEINFTYANGDQYQGGWANGNPEGKGHYTQIKVGTYKGEFKKGIR